MTSRSACSRRSRTPAMRMELEQRRHSIAPGNWLTISIHCVAAWMRMRIVATVINRTVNNRARDKVSNKDNRAVKVNSKVRPANKGREDHKTNSKVARQMGDHNPATRVGGNEAASISRVRSVATGVTIAKYRRSCVSACARRRICDANGVAQQLARFVNSTKSSIV